MIMQKHMLVSLHNNNLGLQNPEGGEWIHKGCPLWVYPSGSMCYMCDHLLETPSMMILHWLTVQRVVSCNNLKRMVGSFEWPMNYRCYVVGQFFRLYCMQSIEPSIPGNFVHLQKYSSVICIRCSQIPWPNFELFLRIGKCYYVIILSLISSISCFIPRNLKGWA